MPAIYGAARQIAYLSALHAATVDLTGPCLYTEDQRVEMTKNHKVRVIIVNKSGLDMIYRDDKYFHGELAASPGKWMDVKNDDVGDFLSNERDYSIVGCSGYVTYGIGDEMVTIAFSNPQVGVNKLNVGTGGEGVWENMDN